PHRVKACGAAGAARSIGAGSAAPRAAFPCCRDRMIRALSAALILACALLPACSNRGAMANPTPAETQAASAAAASESAPPVIPASAPASVATLPDAGEIPDASAAIAVSAPEPPCPEEMARIGRFCVDRWEAHLMVPGADGSLVPHPHT